MMNPESVWDAARRARIGLAEAILCEGKTPAQIAAICAEARKDGHPVLMTRLDSTVFAALPPEIRGDTDYDALSRTGYSLDYIESLGKSGLWSKPLDDICRRAASLKVKSFMYTPKEGEYIPEDAELNEAVHRLIVGQHHSLLVTRDGEITGVLRLTDVFKLVCERIKACKLD